MRYIKTFESFNVNETMDMFTMPSDPIAGAADVYKDIANWIKTEATELYKFVSDRFDEFMDKIEEVVEMMADLIDTTGDKVAKNIEKMFGPITTLSYSEVKRAILSKYGNQLETAIKETKANEGYYWEPQPIKLSKDQHKEQEAGTGNDFTNLPKDSGLVQTVLAILQNIFALNLRACGVPLAFIISLVFGSLGFTAVISMLVSITAGIIALMVIGASRRLVYKIEHGE